ncbi:MAG: amidohydrolase family protein, partial [Sedimentisphaerales bacterium]|nr:amidohydrolase family protein [Sedimentisphaerales bacterium]
MFILHARIVIPLDSAAIVDGAVAIDGPLIIGCGRYRDIISRFGPANEIDLTDCVLLPGLVNAHTHLELSYLKGEVPYRNNFVQWVDSLRELRSQFSDGTFERIISHACRESVQSGVTTVGDISYEHRAWHYLSSQPLRKT